jgi:hypothetical protein
MPQTIIIIVLVSVIGLLLVAIGGCYFAQSRERTEQVLTLTLSPDNAVTVEVES